MVKDIRYVFKKIFIGVGIALILGYIGSLTGFIVFNVYAQEDVPFKVGILNSSGSPTTVQSKDGVLSNIFVNDTQNPLDSFSYYLFGVDTSTCQEDSCNMVADPTRQWRSYNDLTDNLDFNYPYQHSTDVTYLGSISYTFYQQFKLTNSNHYTVMLAIYKSSNDIRFNTNLNPNLTGLNVTIGQGSSERQILSSVDNLEVNYTIYTDRNNSQSHWASISVEFDTDSNFESLGNNEDIYLSSLIFDINSPREGIANIGYPFNNVLYFPSNKSSDVYLKNYLYVIENGSIFYTLDGTPFGEEYDFTSYEDIQVINSIPICSDNITSLSDIGCHIKRVFTMIEKFFIRISNFFKQLFDESFDVSIDSNNDMTPVSNIVNMPITILNRFINGFGAQCRTFIIGSLYGYQLKFDCIDIENYLGDNLWFLIDVLSSIFMCLNIMSLILMFFDKWTSFEDTFDVMYYPLHANTTRDYLPKHGKD